MKPPHMTTPPFALLAVFLTFARPAIAADPGFDRPRATPLFVDGVRDTGQLLPDTAVLARVNDQTITARDFVEAYFEAYPVDRPASDSSGRAEFLNTMINKVILDNKIAAINRPMGFEDRLVMREYTQRVLSNTLFQRMVLDSLRIGEDEVRQVYSQHGRQVHLRQILLPTREAAELVRAQLVGGKIKWNDAVRRYSIAANKQQVPDGDAGWMMRGGLGYETGTALFTLTPGQISRVIEDERGFHVFRCVERRPVPPRDYEAMRREIEGELREYKIPRYADRLQALLRARTGLVYDSTAIAWAFPRFSSTRRLEAESPTVSTLVIDSTIPDYPPSDTSRVLARYKGGVVTLGRFLDEYGHLQPLTRQSVNTFKSFCDFVDGIALEPTRAEYARERGLDKDPLAVRLIENRLKRLRIEHFYQDSVLSKVWVSREERRKYYDENLPLYMTYDKVRYAAISAHSRTAADSLLARLNAGERAQDILHADSLRGVISGSIQEQLENDLGRPFHKLVFEELKPGQATLSGPDRSGGYAVIQLLSFDPGRQLSFEEASEMADRAVQDQKAEALLAEIIERERSRYRIEAHPERVMSIGLVDPLL